MSCPGSILAASILCKPPEASAAHSTPAPQLAADAHAGAGVASPAGAAAIGDASGPVAAGPSGSEGPGDTPGARDEVAGEALQPHEQAAEGAAGTGTHATEETRPAAGATPAVAGLGSVEAFRWKVNAEFKWRCQGPPEQVGPGAVMARLLGRWASSGVV